MFFEDSTLQHLHAILNLKKIYHLKTLNKMVHTIYYRYGEKMDQARQNDKMGNPLICSVILIYINLHTNCLFIIFIFDCTLQINTI